MTESEPFDAFTTIKDIPVGDRRYIHMDFTPDKYARYLDRGPEQSWLCKGCGAIVYDRDRHEMWHDLITRIVTHLTTPH